MRHYLGISPAGPAVFNNVRREDTGEPLLLLDRTAVAKLRVNFSDWLDSGETISSVATTAQNCTVSASTSSPNVDLTISDVTFDGMITMTVTGSTGLAYTGTIRTRRTNRYGDERSYRDYA